MAASTGNGRDGPKIGFAYVKATENHDVVDPEFVDNINGAAVAGLHAGRL